MSTALVSSIRPWDLSDAVPRKFLNYMLIDPRPEVNPPIAYVGLTQVGLHRRMFGYQTHKAWIPGHLNERFSSKSRWTEKDWWLQKLEDVDLIPYPLVLNSPRPSLIPNAPEFLQVISPLAAIQLGEIAYAHILSKAGYRLVNDMSQLGSARGAVHPTDVPASPQAVDWFKRFMKNIIVPQEAVEEYHRLRTAHRKDVGFQPTFERVMAGGIVGNTLVPPQPSSRKTIEVDACVIEGCNRPRHGKELCRKHLTQRRKEKDP